MDVHEESRRLVKSSPELWAECSDATSLARHLHEFGEIKITRLEPETAVAWEGERASGTVRLEPSGWGTRVVLTATPAPSPRPSPAPAPPRAGLLSRMLGALGLRRPGRAEPFGEAPPAVDPPGALTAALDSLGQAHHRPFSRR